MGPPWPPTAKTDTRSSPGHRPSPRTVQGKGVAPHSPHTDKAPATLSPWKGLQQAGVLGAACGCPRLLSAPSDEGKPPCFPGLRPPTPGTQA